MRSFFEGPDNGPNRRICPRMGRLTRYALYVAVISALWGGFKSVEPVALPVIKNFEITSARLVNDSHVEIGGAFNKVRSCDFEGVFGYSGKKLIRVSLNGPPFINRLPREQFYGPWILAPKTSQIELYARHRCATGAVTTKLFDGAIVFQADLPPPITNKP
ncbi:MAG: hypothetical protein ACTHWH_06030 [Marinobacter sp.]